MDVCEALQGQSKVQRTLEKSAQGHVCSSRVACRRIYPGAYARATLPPDLSLPAYTRMRAFVTVGSTRFDALVQRVLSDAVLDVLRQRGYSSIVVQCGNSDFDRGCFTQHGDSWTRKLEGGGTVEVWKFKPSLQTEYEQADLVISHAGMISVNTALRALWLKP